MLTEQQHVIFTGWFDEMRLSFLKAIASHNANERHEQQRRFRLAFRKLNDLLREVSHHDQHPA